MSCRRMNRLSVLSAVSPSIKLSLLDREELGLCCGIKVTAGGSWGYTCKSHFESIKSRFAAPFLKVFAVS